MKYASVAENNSSSSSPSDPNGAPHLSSPTLMKSQSERKPSSSPAGHQDKAEQNSTPPPSLFGRFLQRFSSSKNVTSLPSEDTVITTRESTVFDFNELSIQDEYGKKEIIENPIRTR